MCQALAGSAMIWIEKQTAAPPDLSLIIPFLTVRDTTQVTHSVRTTWGHLETGEERALGPIQFAQIEEDCAQCVQAVGVAGMGSCHLAGEHEGCVASTSTVQKERKVIRRSSQARVGAQGTTKSTLGLFHPVLSHQIQSASFLQKWIIRQSLEALFKRRARLALALCCT